MSKISGKDNLNFDISVIIPIYNVEEMFLRQCLDSVANQTKDNLEVILIDDGSTDNSGEIADEYAESYDNFLCYHIENNGLGHARNYGAQKAHGKYIYFIDSDDIISENILEKMFSAAEKDGSDMAICGVERFNSSKEWDSYLHTVAFRDLASVTKIGENPDLMYDTTSWNKLIRRDYWEKHGFAFPENVLYEDIPTTIPLHVLANKVSVIRSVGYKWRVRDMASKSITQNTTDLVNLVDRIKILKILDSFFEKNVQSKTLHLEKQIKALRFDLMIFINVCLSVEEEQARKIMETISEYINSSISEEALQSLNYIERELYKALLDGDYERFINLTAFRKEEFANCPYIERDGKIFAKLPAELFDREYTDVTHTVKRTVPKVCINDVSAADGAVSIFAYLYFPKINIEKAEDQEVQAFLCNEYTGEEVRLETVPDENNILTVQNGTSFSKLTGEKETYNYNGTGFKITIDLSKLKLQKSFKDCVILLRYKNRFISGTAVLKNMSGFVLKKANGLAVISDESIAKISVAAGETLNISLDKIHCVLNDNKLKKRGLYLYLNHSGKLVAKDEGGNTVELSDEGNNTFFVDAKKLSDDTEYGIFTKTDDGDFLPVVRTNKAVNLKSNSKNAFVVRSNKTHNVAIRKLSETTFLKSFNRNGDILTLKTVSAGALDSEKYTRAKIVIEDSLSGKSVILAKSKCTPGENQLRCKFNIDFSNPKVQKNLYKSNRDIFIEYFNENGKRKKHRIFSKKYIKEPFEFNTLGIVFYRFSQGYLKLKLSLLWPDEEASFKKRKALMSENYPKYREEPINEKLILFESMWGTKYSCNPQAIYEYINKNYPQYECVWSLKDPRTPIKGRAKRVRRGSQEYYKILATAKYLVNNVNFEDDYIKRNGQIEIQTMHGTPLKSLGLDVDRDFKTIADREKFIKKCSRWDYLIVQGRFMESMAYQIYMFNKKILKTGYPRTDVLYKESDVDKIKASLGIPLDKKVVLYTPTWRVRNKFDMQLDLEKMEKALGNDYVLLIRLHHLCANGYDVPADNKFIFDLTNYTDVQDLYEISDMLITDYSSVMFDYALLGKPMLFYVYDLNTYSEATRGVYFDIREEAPGPIVYTTDEVINAITNIDEEMEKIADRASAFKNKYLTYECSNSAKKVVEEVIKPSKTEAFVFKVKRKLLG